jgi:hypothetical protein
LAQQLKYIYGMSGQAEIKKSLATGTGTGNWTGTFWYTFGASLKHICAEIVGNRI